MTDETKAEVAETKPEEVKEDNVAEVKAEEAAGEAPAADDAAADAEGGEEEEGEGEEEDEEAGGEEGDGAETSKRPAEGKKAAEPVTLGYKTFSSSTEALDYFKGILSTTPVNTDFNEYEYRVLLDLLQKGHPNATAKIGACGLRAFQVRPFPNGDNNAKAIYAVRKDGSMEDFSYIKCLSALFPNEVNGPSAKRPRHNGGGGREGRGGRGGRGGRDGPGGRGRGRGGRRGRGRGRH